MKIIRLSISIIFFLASVMLLLGELQEFTLLTFVVKILMGLMCLYLGVMLFPLKLPFNKKQEQIAENILTFFLLGVVILVLILLFITLG